MNSPEDIKKQIVIERESLARQFVWKKSRTWLLSEMHYKISTCDVANTRPYLEYHINEFVAYYPKHIAKLCGALAIITSLLLVFFYDDIEDTLRISLVMLILITGFISFKSISYDRNRNPQLIVDRAGIYVAKIDSLIPWDLLVATYIRVEGNGEDDTYFLNIYYYSNQINNFTDIEISLADIYVDHKKLSYAIEYFKMNCETMRDV